jgi:hypothetical protein
MHGFMYVVNYIAYFVDLRHLIKKNVRMLMNNQQNTFILFLYLQNNTIPHTELCVELAAKQFFHLAIWHDNFLNPFYILYPYTSSGLISWKCAHIKAFSSTVGTVWGTATRHD